MSIHAGIWVGFSVFSVVAIVGYLVVLCVNYSRKASAADHLLNLFKDDREGIYKRIEEARELQNVIQVCVQEGHAMPWVLSWAYSQERWLEQLANDLEVLDPEIAMHGVRGRKRYGL